MEWIDIVGYEGLYQVNKLGDVKSLKRNTAREKNLKQKKTKYGYKTVTLSKNGVSKCKSVHRLVAQTFVNNFFDKPCVNHIDCDKTNNKFDNLEWVDYKENMAHAYKNGLVKLNKGSKNGMSKLVKQDILDIFKLEKFISRDELSAMFDVNVSHINALLRGEKWKHLKIKKDGGNYEKVINYSK